MRPMLVHDQQTTRLAWWLKSRAFKQTTLVFLAETEIQMPHNFDAWIRGELTDLRSYLSFMEVC